MKRRFLLLLLVLVPLAQVQAQNTVYLYDSTGTGSPKAQGTSVNEVWGTAASGDVIVLTGNATCSALNNQNKSSYQYTIRSDGDTVRTITASSGNRFMNYAAGTYSLGNLTFTGFGLNSFGGVFWQNNGEAINLFADNVTFDGNTTNYDGAVMATDSISIAITGSTTFTNNTSGSLGTRGGAISVHLPGGSILFYGDGSTAVFSGNRDKSGANDMYVAGQATFRDKGTYVFNSGVILVDTFLEDGVEVTLGSGSINSLTNVTSTNGGALIIHPNALNVVASGTTSFATGATQTALTGSYAAQSPGSGMASFGVDTSLFSGSNPLADGQEILVATGAALTGVGKPIIHTYNDNGYLAVLKSNANNALTVGLVATTDGHTVYRVDSTGTLQSSGTNFNTVMTGYASGDTMILRADTNTASFNLTNDKSKVITFQSDCNEVRTITGTSGTRFMDYANGTIYVSNLKLTGFGKDSGCVFWNGGGEINIVADNVTFDKNISGSYNGPVIASNTGDSSLAGTAVFSNNRAKNKGGAISLLQSGNFTFKGDGSDVTFTGNTMSNGSVKNDIYLGSGTVTFQDKGSYSFDGGIQSTNLAVTTGAQVTLESGALTILAGNLTVDADSTLTVCLNQSNVADVGATDFNSAATRTTVSGALSGAVTFDLSGISVTGAKQILAIQGDFSAYTQQVTTINQSNGYFIYDILADANWLKFNVQQKIDGANVYQYTADGSMAATSTGSLNDLTIGSGDTLLLTGGATISGAIRLSDSLSIRTAASDVQTISGLGTSSAFVVDGFTDLSINNITFNNFAGAQAGAIYVADGATLTLTGQNVTFANNTRQSATGTGTPTGTPNDITVAATGSLVFKDGARYALGGGIVSPKLSVEGGSLITLGSGSLNELGTTTASSGSALIIQPNASNIVASGTTSFAIGATQTALTSLYATQSPGSGIASFGVDTSLFSNALGTDQVILVATGAALAGVGKPIIQTYNDNGYLAVLKSNANNALAVGLVATTDGHTVYRVDSSGTLQKSDTSFNTTMAGFASGDTIILRADTSANLSLGSSDSSRVFTFQSDTHEMRTIAGTSSTRFMDWAAGTFYLSNLKFAKFGAGNGSVFWVGDGSMTFYLDNVIFEENSNGYTGPVAAISNGTMTYSGTAQFIKNQAKNNGGALSILGTGNMVFKGDGSDMTFTGNSMSSGTVKNDIFVNSGSVTFQDKGTYVFEDGIRAATVNVKDGASVTLGSESSNAITTLTVANASEFTAEASLSVGTFSLDKASSLYLGNETRAAALTVSSALTLDGDVYLDLFADGTSDQILLTGSTFSLGDDASLILVSESLPDTRNQASYTLLEGIGDTPGILDHFDLSALPSGYDWSLTSGSGSVQLNADNSAYVPEPSTWILLLVGVAGMWFVRRRR